MGLAGLAILRKEWHFLNPSKSCSSLSPPTTSLSKVVVVVAVVVVVV